MSVDAAPGVKRGADEADTDAPPAPKKAKVDAPANGPIDVDIRVLAETVTVAVGDIAAVTVASLAEAVREAADLDNERMVFEVDARGDGGGDAAAWVAPSSLDTAEALRDALRAATPIAALVTPGKKSLLQVWVRAVKHAAERARRGGEVITAAGATDADFSAALPKLSGEMKHALEWSNGVGLGMRMHGRGPTNDAALTSLLPSTRDMSEIFNYNPVLKKKFGARAYTPLVSVDCDFCFHVLEAPWHVWQVDLEMRQTQYYGTLESLCEAAITHYLSGGGGELNVAPKDRKSALPKHFMALAMY